MRKGFTLIELLVVIAIIAILASILFPVFSRAREKARQTSCLSNTKQLMLAVIGYTDDYDEVLPTNSMDTGAGVYSWRTMLMPYVKNTQIFMCPSNKITTGAFHSAMDVTAGEKSGYGMNVNHWGPAGAPASPTPAYGQDLGGCEDSSSVILLFESDGSESVGDEADAHGWVPSAGTWWKRHNDGSNVAFVDGHAKWMKPTAFCKASGDCLCSRELE
jgi:prepilin-type N-terminal cleavage/methylation domain-containing protein/prepilin-type processing-associated H-X9-DG protein